jgi:hypothetical protein
MSFCEEEMVAFCTGRYASFSNMSEGNTPLKQEF